MTLRKCILAISAIFAAFMMWLIVEKDSALAMSAFIPMCIVFVFILMLPEERLKGDAIIKIIRSWRGKKDVD